MQYYCGNEILVRDMAASDIDVIVREEMAQGWHVTDRKYLKHFRDRDAGECVALTAEYCGSPAGYIHVYFHPKTGPYVDKGCCEIVDFGVLEKYRRKGIGAKLMDAAEEIAAQFDDTVSLAVGLHSGYGCAQRMYVKRGYIPDGSGVWYDGQPAEPYRDYCNDDSLYLYFLKRLR